MIHYIIGTRTELGVLVVERIVFASSKERKAIDFLRNPGFDGSERPAPNKLQMFTVEDGSIITADVQPQVEARWNYEVDRWSAPVHVAGGKLRMPVDLFNSLPRRL